MIGTQARLKDMFGLYRFRVEGLGFIELYRLCRVFIGLGFKVRVFGLRGRVKG